MTYLCSYRDQSWSKGGSRNTAGAEPVCVALGLDTADMDQSHFFRNVAVVKYSECLVLLLILQKSSVPCLQIMPKQLFSPKACLEISVSSVDKK